MHPPVPSPLALLAAIPCLAAFLVSGCIHRTTAAEEYYPGCNAALGRLQEADPANAAPETERLVACYDDAYASVFRRYRAGFLSRGAVLRRHEEIRLGMVAAADIQGDPDGALARRMEEWRKAVRDLLLDEPEGGVVPRDDE
ncbi:MAG: hypothetical protein LBR22_04050 [Desulfovibrio sp.]|jgi:hypothetical protein|nr:hypothetical protein [Desulfovibrio sp.]